MTPILETKALCASYSGRTVLSSVNLSLLPGERLAVLGANGAGKSTLLHAIAGFVPISSGTLSAFGTRIVTNEDFTQLRRRVGIVFQDPDDQLFCPTVLEDVAFGPRNLGQSPQQADQTARATLETLALEHLADRPIHKLSGGEKRLVSLAGVLAMNPDILLLDEPTAGLDETALARMLAILSDLPQAMLIVAHDAVFIGALATRAILLKDGTSHHGVIHTHPHTQVQPHAHFPMAARSD